MGSTLFIYSVRRARTKKFLLRIKRVPKCRRETHTSDSPSSNLNLFAQVHVGTVANNFTTQSIRERKEIKMNKKHKKPKRPKGNNGAYEYIVYVWKAKQQTRSPCIIPALLVLVRTTCGAKGTWTDLETSYLREYIFYSSICSLTKSLQESQTFRSLNGGRRNSTKPPKGIQVSEMEREKIRANSPLW
jgi:hypothetical protein